jgi:probable phosphomutase (TIGR03848 family)
MATVILVRHGRTTANVEGVLAGRTAGVALDEVGRQQAARTADRLAVVPLVGVVSSPLERCRETAASILSRQIGEQLQPVADEPERPGLGQAREGLLSIDEALNECDYGDWQGRKLRDLAGEELWSVVQGQPSAAVFPGGESMAGMQSRAVAAIRGHDALVEEQHGAGAVWAAVSHGDVIKSILADALGMHLDLFQRIAVGPASVSIVRYGRGRPEVVSTNTDAGDLSWLAAAPAPEPDAPVGGGAGR